MKTPLLLKRLDGFTLLEILVVTATLAVLASVAVVRYAGYLNDAKATTAKQNLAAVVSAKDLYYYNPGRTASEQTTFNGFMTSNSARFNAIQPYLSISGSAPANTAALAVGTSGTDLIIGNITTAPKISGSSNMTIYPMPGEEPVTIGTGTTVIGGGGLTGPGVGGGGLGGGGGITINP